MAELQVLLMDGVGRRGGGGVSSNGEIGGGVEVSPGRGEEGVRGRGVSHLRGWETEAMWTGLGQGPVPVFREEVWGQAQRLAVLCDKLEEENRWEREYTQSRPVLLGVGEPGLRAWPPSILSFRGISCISYVEYGLEG